MGELPVNIEWVGHATFAIREEKTIYFDPYQVQQQDEADIILITHSHFDHCSTQDIKKIAHENTVVVTPADGSCDEKLPSQLTVKHLRPGETLELEGVTVQGVAAYNVGKQFHPRENHWLGYLVTLKDTTVYHAGDTDFIPEMESIKADIAVVPIGGTYTMDADEAAKAVNTIGPQWAIPMHYGSVVGSTSDADRFEELCQCNVKRFDR